MSGWAVFGIAVAAFTVGLLYGSILCFVDPDYRDDEGDEHEQHHA